MNFLPRRFQRNSEQVQARSSGASQTQLALMFTQKMKQTMNDCNPWGAESTSGGHESLSAPNAHLIVRSSLCKEIISEMPRMARPVTFQYSYHKQRHYKLERHILQTKFKETTEIQYENLHIWQWENLESDILESKQDWSLQLFESHWLELRLLESYQLSRLERRKL